MSEFEDIDFDDEYALCTEDQYSFWSVVSYWPWRCQGITRSGVQCQAICRKVKLEDFWPGISDRCVHHVDELARRTQVMARIAQRTRAAEVEALPPYERHHRLKEIRRAEQARTAATRRSVPSPVEPASRRANGATGRSGPRGQLRLPCTPTENASMSTDSPAEVALLRCPHTDQPPLEVTWFRGQCSRCHGSIQVPKHEFDELVAGGRRVILVCFECWTRADSNFIPLARIPAEGGAP